MIGFRLLGEGDLPRLVTWLRAPHVSAWWHPMTPAEIAAKYLPRLRGETATRVHAILLDAEPIGMLQATPVEGGEADTCSIDLLIGDADLVGIGLGPRIIDAFAVGEVFGRLGFASCLADPADGNLRSVRAFEKAGFTRRSVEVAGQVISLMARER